MAKTEALRLAHISVRGVVQGVGFRPFVYGLATKYNLEGCVYNTSEDVKIEVEGKTEAIRQFQLELKAKAPPLAHIEDIITTYRPPTGYKKFEIRHSTAEEGKYQLISPDIATCQTCLSELLNPDDRRYRYPFTNCTNCGPRFTIIESMPYDRPKTTMRHFQMCSQCQAEYNNPLDRRFHAQPNACPKCGPKVKLVDKQGNPVIAKSPATKQFPLDAIAIASQLLKEGKIIAIKGLGGFLLACDASNGTAVKTLRQRKRRPFKPFAIMVANMDEVNRHCHVSLEEEKLLASPQNPIVLMKWRDDSSVSREVAPNLQYLGVMLPYTPLHHILLRDTQLPLVMTSGNLSEEPIAKDNDEALRRLSGIADYFLIHNRDIYSRYDDSVAIVERETHQLARRARSYSPYPITLPFRTKQVLGCGAEMKSTFCLTKDSYAFLSQHIGDLENWETLEHFVSTISLYERLFHIKPEIIAYDLHPDYLSTKYAQELGRAFANAQDSLCIKLIPIQHHHAHIASCMADNGLETPVIGVAFDGTGLGSDGHIWGGEFLVVDYQSFNRMGHLEYLPLPGGDAAIKRPYRTAIGYILSLLGENTLSRLTLKERVNKVEVGIIKRQLETRLNSPLNSSMGRLFDAVSALIGIRDKIDYEGQAAIELEMAAYSCHCKEHVSRSSEPFASCHSEGLAEALSIAKGKRPKNLLFTSFRALAHQGKLREEDEAISDDKESYPYHIIEDKGVKVVKLAILLSAVIGDLSQGTPQGRISIKFHNTIAKMTNEICQVIANETGIKQVALSGGVFQNRLLLRKTVNLLENNGFQVFTHRQVPCNDGGISLGQAVIANFAE